MHEDRQSIELVYPDAEEEDVKRFNIETLIENYGNDVLRIAYMYVKDLDLAEDIFQDVFVKVNQKIDTFKGKSSIKTWIIRITINESKDYLKSAWNRRVFPISEYHTDTLVSEDNYKKIENQEIHRLVRDSVMKLPNKHKDVILCVYFLEMTIKETAKFLNIKEGTAKSRLSRAKDTLREVLEGKI